MKSRNLGATPRLVIVFAIISCHGEGKSQNATNLTACPPPPADNTIRAAGRTRRFVSAAYAITQTTLGA